MAVHHDRLAERMRLNRLRRYGVRFMISPRSSLDETPTAHAVPPGRRATP